ncbi:MAG TPA: response regulator [Candidatus Altiarchaeales archaeon]|nr:response regulator [Candidatus Altiarchaeales archaeon]
MPKMHGPEAAKEIISYDRNARIIIVSVLKEWSTSSDKRAVDKSKKLGIKAYVEKPIDKKKLVSTVKRVLGQI